jgi:hypothetical protein
MHSVTILGLSLTFVNNIENRNIYGWGKKRTGH